MTYDNPVCIFVSKMLKFSDVISIFFIIGLERRFSDFLNTLRSISSDRSKGKKLSFKCSTGLQNFRICLENLELVYIYLWGLDVILSVQDVVN